MKLLNTISDETNSSSPLGVEGRRIIDISTWKRREHFEAFKNFDEPLFGVVVKVECSAAYNFAKENGYPFSLYYLYLSLKTVNEIEEFRYRIENDIVYCYNRVGASPTIFRNDETYGCGFFSYYERFEEFMSFAKIEIERVKSENGLKYPHAGEDTIHYSTAPWLDFTSVNHARKFDAYPSVPKITFGKITREGEKMWLPVDLHANHALMDGFHAGKFFMRFQELLNQ